MTAPTLTPLYDQALEELLDHQVACEATDECDTCATWRVLAPCGHGTNARDLHRREMETWLARQIIIACTACNNRFSPDRVRFEAV